MSDKETFKKELNERTAEIEKLTETYLPEETGHRRAIPRAMNYSIRADGRYLHPMLVQEVCRLFTGCLLESVIPFMAAIEMIHTSSLVCDDLPCMDDDMMRGGKASIWAEFGEDIGILAGDTLMIYAFETASCAFRTSVDPDELSRIGKTVEILARKAGAYDAIGGQMVNVKLAGGPIPTGKLGFIYHLKADTLVEVFMLIDAVPGGAADEDCKIAESPAFKVDMAFQIQDNILDVADSEEAIGKPVNSDGENKKTTYVTLESLEEAKQGMEKISTEAIEELSKLSGNNDFLGQSIHLLIHRQKQAGIVIRRSINTILEHIKGSEKLKPLPPEELGKLSQEICEFLTERISHTGGHLASNLGVMELTITLHLTFNFPEDKVIWDVGHQSYTHKILTRRTAEFNELYQYGRLSGFPKRKESPYDSPDMRHSSISISAGLGIALGRDLRGLGYKVVSVIGDGVLTDGVAYGALSNAARMKRNFIIVLNGNDMSTSENVGDISCYLNGLHIGSGYNGLKRNVADALDRIPAVESIMIDRIKRTKNSIKQLFIPGMFFESMDITYLGLMDGHNTPTLCKVLGEAQKLGHAVLVYVITKKGKGYRPTEKNSSHFHGVGPFDVDTGRPSSEQKGPSHADVFSRKICQPGERYPNLVAVAVAVPGGTRLTAFGKEYSHHFFDVSITEAHVVTSAAGIAAAGLEPVVAVYFSLLQRAYDQTLYDVCIQNLPVLFAVSRAGLVGGDGGTHQGIFGYSFLTSISNMSVMAPKNMWELRAMLEFAMGYDRPLAVRYSRGEAYQGLGDFKQPVTYGKGETFYEERDIALLTVSSMVNTGGHVREKLGKKGYACPLTNGHFVKPIDIELVNRLAGDRGLIVTSEENVFQGGYGLAVTAYIHQDYPRIKVLNVTLPNDYVEHGNASILREELGIGNDSTVRAMEVGGWMNRLN